ncbi:Gfo/Idh/MocA family oxidoreductase [Aquabacterium sp. J223]|nr:Gfo/Idh/MocA family oxidoreductase [Aquabacterium sp. J223]UUX97932.1 Gfo/Idh/MocA family oxidoreductase [Aquabacterium sp. J223]
MPDRPLRLGVAGLGRAFSLMLPTFLADRRVQLVAACDPRQVARDQFARDFSATVHETVEALADDPAVEAVYIASPHQFHVAHTEVVAARGKHILVEKPMAITLDECDRMLEACRRGGVQLVVGHCHSFDTPYLETRRLIDSGRLGRVRMVQALNYTDFLYRPRRPEELRTAEGGGVVFSQAAHQVDIVRLLAGSRATRVRSVSGAWDPSRPTEGAYSALMWFEDGAFANLTYSGYGHFDSDEWMQWQGELGQTKSPADHGAARRKLAQLGSPEEETRLKAAATYAGPAWKMPSVAAATAHQHFGPTLISCERGVIRPMADGLWVLEDDRRSFLPIAAPTVPRAEVMDELLAVARHGRPPLHDGLWGRATLEACLALLTSASEGRDVSLSFQVALRSNQ